MIQIFQKLNYTIWILIVQLGLKCARATAAELRPDADNLKGGS